MVRERMINKFDLGCYYFLPITFFFFRIYFDCKMKNNFNFCALWFNEKEKFFYLLENNAINHIGLK